MKYFDSLRVFDVVARHLSFTDAGRELNVTKGAISYQIGRLENQLGFAVFDRQHRRIVLTEKGVKLWHASQAAFGDLDRQIAELKDAGPARITVGMSTYFASRWLSPRLMHFITDHPSVGLRLQPLVDLIDLGAQDIDMAIRWGRGQWSDVEIEPLLPCPAFVTAGPDIARRVTKDGLATIIGELALLHDRDGSEAWTDWHMAAGLPGANTRNELVIPDPNVRVQAVIDGQGIALNDNLIADEIAAGRLSRISPVELADYGYYLAYPSGALDAPALRDFRDWIMSEAAS